MNTIRRTAVATCIVFCMFFAAPSMAGSIILANDEWTLSDDGFSNAGTSAENFAINIASYFTGGSAGNFLVYSGNFGLTGNKLNQVMTNAGHSWTVSLNVSFDLQTLSGYDGVFLAGNPADNNVLINYVEAGGNVYLAAGTGFGGGGASGEAAKWNTFLNYFGLGLDGNSYNSINGNIPVSSSHEIFQNVTVLYQLSGNNVLDTDPTDPQGRVLVTYNGNGLYAVYENRLAVPEPPYSALLLIGMIIGLFNHRNRVLRRH